MVTLLRRGVARRDVTLFHGHFRGLCFSPFPLSRDYYDYLVLKN